MARTPSDATRFTATSPHISSQPSQPSQPSTFASNPPPGSTPPTSSRPTSSRLQNLAGPAPPNETPQQKILRLRRAAALSRMPKETAFDRTVRIGRVWADRAHRITAWGLIGLTGVCGVVAAVGITDMLVHNRNRRNEWLAQKRLESARELSEARQALGKGSVTEQQALVLNQERARVEAEEAKKNRPGFFKRVFGSGEGEKEEKGIIQWKEDGRGDSGRGVLEAVEDKAKGVEASVMGERRSGERLVEAIKPVGGPLDREAERATSALLGTGKSWTSWLTGR